MPSRFTDLESLDSVCGLNSNGAIRLLKGSYIIEVYMANETLSRRQDLPERAFWQESITKNTPIVAVSWPWLSAERPDKDGQHVAVLGPLLAKYIEHLMRERILPYDDVCDVAVFIDWGCLYQKERTNDQTQIFNMSLRDMSLLYAHARTAVWCLTQVPPESDWDQPYDHRGWCTFEQRIASIISTGNKLLNLGLLEIDPDEVTDFGKQVDTLQFKRKPPLLPDDFKDLLHEKQFLRGFKYKFVNGADRETVIDMYEEIFNELVSEVAQLEFSSSEWNDDDVKQLAKILPRCDNLNSLLLHGNNFEDDAAYSLCRVFPETLEQLDARNNNLSFVFEESYPYGETNSRHLDKAQRNERKEWRKRYLAAFQRRYSVANAKRMNRDHDRFKELHFDADWAEIPPPHQSRSACGLAPSGDDDIILVGGRSGDGTVLNSVEVFSFFNQSWTKLPSLNTARSNCASIVVDGKLYVFGGACSDGTLDECEVLDLLDSSGGFATMNARLPSETKKNTVAVCEKNIVYLIGGNDSLGASSEVSAYDTILGDIEKVQPMREKRSRPGVAIVGQNIIVMGGKDENDEILTSCECYNTLRREWSYDIPEIPLKECIAQVIAVEPNDVIVLTVNGNKLIYNTKKKAWQHQSGVFEDGKLSTDGVFGIVGSVEKGSNIVSAQNDGKVQSLGFGPDPSDDTTYANSTEDIIEKKHWYSCALSGEGENIDVGELTWSPVTDPAKVWKMDVRGTPNVFICHRGPETKESIARPTYWFLTKKLKWRAFLDEECSETSGQMKKTLAAAHSCSHALIILSPGFRRSDWCVKQLNTFMSRRESKSGMKLIPALFGMRRLRGYSDAVRRVDWLRNENRRGQRQDDGQNLVDEAEDFMIETLWSYLLNKVGNSNIDGGFREDDLERFLSEYNTSRERTKPKAASSNDVAALSESKAVIRDWLLAALPRLTESDLSQYTDELLDKGFDSSDLLKSQLRADDLNFMKSIHSRTVCQHYLHSQEFVEVGTSSVDDASALSKNEAVIREWLLEALPDLAETNLNHYTDKLLDNGFDSLHLLKTQLRASDLEFMKNIHSRAICQHHLQIQENVEVGNGDGDRRFTDDAAALSESKAAIRKWLLGALPKLREADLSQYTDRLLEDGFDSLDLLKNDLEADDLDFMKKVHRKAICRVYLQSQQSDQVENVDDA